MKSASTLRNRAALMHGQPLTMYSGEVVRLMAVQPSKSGHRVRVTGPKGCRMISVTCLVNLDPDAFYPECVERMKANGQGAWNEQQVSK